MDQLLIEIHRSLGINESHLQANRLAFHSQPPLKTLQVAELDFSGRPFVLESSTAEAWAAMKAAADTDGVALLPFSGFRSYLQQKKLIEDHLQNGRSLDFVLTHIAIPGFSEHHTGRAIDLHAPGRTTLEEAFENSAAFQWLKENAKIFAFRLSYPKENPMGIVYEPWHWFFTGDFL